MCVQYWQKFQIIENSVQQNLYLLWGVACEYMQSLQYINDQLQHKGEERWK